MIYLTIDEVLELHRDVIARSGGDSGVKDRGLLESAVAQPRMTFGGEDLYPTIVEKAAALAFSLVKNHSFVDGNKRIGHASMEVFLVLNGWQIDSNVDEQEALVLRLAAGLLSREDFTEWLRQHVVELAR